MILIIIMLFLHSLVCVMALDIENIKEKPKKKSYEWFVEECKKKGIPVK